MVQGRAPQPDSGVGLVQRPGGRPEEDQFGQWTIRYGGGPPEETETFVAAAERIGPDPRPEPVTLGAGLCSYRCGYP